MTDILPGREAMMATYSPPDIAFEKGEGSWLYANDGRKYLDFYSGIAVCSFGHAHPHLVKALKDQAEKFWHCSNMFRITETEKLAQRLVDNSFATKVFFSNSGAEANECGLKILRKYQESKGRPERKRIIGFHSAFHGRTIGTISAAGNPGHTAGFVMEDEGYDHVPYGDLKALEAAITDKTAGIIFEPVQGEGGIRPATVEFVRGIRALCDKHDILMMVDEVQCGMGRTGKMFGYEWSGVEPDVMSLAKGMGGGFPVGACLANDKAAAPMIFGTHGSTFGGNPLAGAVGNAVLDLMLEKGFLQSVTDKANKVRAELEGLIAKHPKALVSVHGLGLMIGIKCVVPNGDMLLELRKQGLLCAKSGDNQIRFLPPLNVSDAELDAAIEIFDRACTALTA
ncbi:aspartate aminotransferase family protein [Kiloniella laminariae]|uniref:Acetylornithine aminotransferase n=1 Tax=Kiloniella laminariae TaxID=454162 RepID=A0ABT4LIQ8_9PROT|nr:aspartate aminotransferase family protein [Kiloniella laminariae]MCZ4280991.1 aspartate aminotransferase family protein [Kiloniella laminariae]